MESVSNDAAIIFVRLVVYVVTATAAAAAAAAADVLPSRSLDDGTRGGLGGGEGDDGVEEGAETGGGESGGSERLVTSFLVVNEISNPDALPDKPVMSIFEDDINLFAVSFSTSFSRVS